jgi:hypothetical protein
MQEETFKRTANVMLLGIYIPLYIFIRCILYYYLIPSSVVSLSAISPTMLSISLPKFSLIKPYLLYANLARIELKCSVIGVKSDELEVAGSIV